MSQFEWELIDRILHHLLERENSPEALRLIKDLDLHNQIRDMDED